MVLSDADSNTGGLSEGFPEAEWPPAFAPEHMICDSCEYPIGGLRVELPAGVVTCPECGVRARFARRDDGAKHLGEYAVACRNEQGREYAVDVIAASLFEAQAIARADGHPVQPQSASAAQLPTHDLSFPVAILAGIFTLAGVIHLFVAIPALALGVMAVSMSRRRRGLGVSIVAACEVAVHLALMWLR